MRDDPLFDLVVLDDVDPAGAGDGLDGGRRHEQRRRGARLLKRARWRTGRASAGRRRWRRSLRPSARADRLERRRDEADRGGELSPGYASTVSRTGWPTLTSDDGLLRHRQLDAQRIDADDRRDLRRRG